MTKNSVYRTCGPEELEMLTRSGWSLKSILSSGKMVDVHENVAAWDEAPQRTDGQYNMPGWKHTTVTNKAVVADVMFLLELNEDSAVAQLESKVAELAKKIVETDEAKKNLERELAAEKTRAMLAVEDFGRISAYLARTRTEAEELLKTKNRMEQDLAKVQRAVGELRMREIVGGPA